jgi:prepilin-type N-terminal cleavage/methylation domain-containing protein
MKTTLIGENSGYSLVELMITVAVISIPTLLVAQVFQQLSRGMLYTRATKTRDEIVRNIRQFAGSREALLASATDLPANSDLNNCLNGTGSCANLQAYPLALHGHRGASTDVFSGPPSAAVLNSPPQDWTGGLPRRFNVNGYPCAPGEAESERCALEVYTVFKPQCLPPVDATTNLITRFKPPADCGGKAPEFIEVTYLVRTAQGVRLGDSQGVGVLAPVEGRILVEIL